MKTKFISAVLILAMLLQVCFVASVFANTDVSVNIDFSGDVVFSSTTDLRPITGVIDGVQGYSLVKGQYGKAPDDVSLRMYTAGGSYSASSKRLDVRNDNVTPAQTGEYSHVSFQYLNENLFSTLTVRMTSVLTTNETVWEKEILIQPANSSHTTKSRLFTNGDRYNWETRPPLNLDYSNTIGTWTQVDLYFSYDSTIATMFINGLRSQFELPTWATSPIKTIKKLEFIHNIMGSSPYVPSAVQIDNIIFEKVNSIPQSQNYTYLGEKLDFDDSMAIGTSGQYRIKLNGSETNRFSTAIASAYPAVKFNAPSVNTLASGVFGRYSWDKSLHTSIGTDAADGASALYYNTGVKSLKSGDVGHLTFAIANNTSGQSAGVQSTGAVFSDGTLDTVDLFEMSAENGKFKFFGEDTTAPSWQSQQWYKVDLLFKVGDGSSTYTMVDGYIDGVKYISDYELKLEEGNFSPLKFIGTLGFTDKANADYYLDDITFGSFDSSNYNNPSNGWSIESSNTDLRDAINNEERVITVAGNYKVEDFLKNISNPDLVTLYNSNGIAVDSGLLANCIVKVSNNYGSGIYYTVESTGVVTETNLFDIADGAVLVTDESNVLNVSAENEAEPVVKTELYIDGKLETSVNSDNLSVELGSLMLGKHEFEAYAYINDKDCYMDFVSLTFVEEKENTILASQNYESYVPGAAISGGRLVQKGGKVLSETISDKTGKDYGKSLVFQSTKEEYIAANNSHDFYMDISTPEANMITKGIFEFDICYLTEGINFASNIRGKTSFESTNNTGASYSPFTLGTTTNFRGQQVSLEVNKWYNIKCMVDLKNGLTSMWIDDVPVAENVAFSSSMVQMASELRIEARLPSSKYDSVDTYRFFAIDNIAFSEYDELAYIDSIEDESGASLVDYEADVITLKMSRAVEGISNENVTLHSTNGVREIKSVTIDADDASILYVTPKYPLSSADLYSVVISSGMKSAGSLSTKSNCGFFETTAKNIDVLSGDFEYKNEVMNFTAKLTNQTNSNKDLIVIAYVYEGDIFKGIAAKTVTTRAGKNMNVSLELPYYSNTSKVYGLVTDNWNTLKPITNKLYSYSYNIDF